MRSALRTGPQAAVSARLAAPQRSPGRCPQPRSTNRHTLGPRFQPSHSAASGAQPGFSPPSLPAVQPARPPDDYDYASVFRDRSVAFCREHFPEIVDLAEAGVVVVVQRPADYVERREDGYECAIATSPSLDACLVLYLMSTRRAKSSCWQRVRHSLASRPCLLRSRQGAGGCCPRGHLACVAHLGGARGACGPRRGPQKHRRRAVPQPSVDHVHGRRATAGRSHQ